MKIGFAFALALFLAASPARAEVAGDGGPCEEILALLGDAPAGATPRLIMRHDQRYRDWEGYIEFSVNTSTTTKWPDAVRAYTALVTPACRAETRRGAAPEATAAARALTQLREPGWINRGRILLCTMQDPDSLGEVAAWMADPDHPEARAVCASELATWPGAEPVRGPIFTRAARACGRLLHVAP